MGKPNKTFLGLSVLKLLVFSLPRIGYPLFLIYLVCYAWMTLGPQKPQVNVIRQRAADRAAFRALAEIRAHRGSLTNVKMFHFANDPTDCLTLKFRNVLDGTGVLNLHDMTMFERLRRFANMRESGCAGTLSMKFENPPTFSRHKGGSVKITTRITRNWMKSQVRVALSPPRKV